MESIKSFIINEGGPEARPTGVPHGFHDGPARQVLRATANGQSGQ